MEEGGKGVGIEGCCPTLIKKMGVLLPESTDIDSAPHFGLALGLKVG